MRKSLNILYNRKLFSATDFYFIFVRSEILEGIADTKCVLVTGACGLIGEKICSGLLKRKYRVIGTDSKSSDYNLSKAGYTFCKADHTDKNIFDKLFREEHVDTLIHCACTADNDLGDIITEDDIRHSAAYDDFLFALAYSHDVRKIISISTSQVYEFPKSREPIRETDKLKIDTNYARLKYDSERKLSMVVGQNTERIAAVLRIPPVYTSDYTVNLISKIFDQETDSLYVYHNGDYGFHFCCLHNLVEFILCFLRMANSNKFTGIFNIADANLVTAREIIKFARNRRTYGPALQRNLSKDLLKSKINKLKNKNDYKTNYRYNDLDTFFNNNILDSTKAMKVCTNFKWNIENTK